MIPISWKYNKAKYQEEIIGVFRILRNSTVFTLGLFCVSRTTVTLMSRPTLND